MIDKNILMAHKIASAVKNFGGRTFYVGGYVRDKILGLDNKDIDIEIHGITIETLEKILDELGERMNIGASFGVMNLKHYEIDITMPCSEKFNIAPFIGTQKAALRRDFTMNALMQDVLTNEILDFFGGQNDIKNHLIRHVNNETFVIDSLRVFRTAQFAARFNFSVADETKIICSKIDVSQLPKERIFTELEKALLKSEKPSIFFENLREINKLSDWFPELEILLKIPQNSKYHPEGNVWNHTMQVLNEAALLKNQSSKPFWFMLSALCHDFGKSITTQEINGQIHSYKHEIKGLPIIEKFLYRLTNEIKLIKYVLNMSELHMQPYHNVQENSHVKSFMKLFNRSVNQNDLLLLSKADNIGRVGKNITRNFLLKSYEKTELKLQKMLKIYNHRMSQPYVMGKDIINLGIEPSPLVGKILQYVHKLRLAGISKDEQLRHVLALINKNVAF